MTTLVVNRVINDDGHKQQRIQAVVPVARATDAEFEAFFLAQLREYLFRSGKSEALTVSDERLLSWVRDLFAI